MRQHRAGEQRQQRHQRHERHVLEQQHRERVPPGGGGQQLALGQHRQHDRRRGQRQPRPQHRRRRPIDAGQPRQTGEQQRGRQHLADAQAEHRAAEDPKPVRPQFQPDQEQQHDHAEFRDLGDLPDIGDQPQPGRPDHRAGDQVAEDGAEAEPARQRHRDRGGRQQGHQRGEHRRVSRAGGRRAAYPSARGTQGMRATSMPSSANASACSGVVSP